MSLNGYVKLKVLWSKNNTTQVDLTRHTKTVTTTVDFEPHNNIANITMVDNDDIYLNNVFLPQEGDTVIVYAKIITSNTSTTLSSSDILWTGKFVDHTRTDSPDSSTVKFKVTDFTYDIFNRFWDKNYSGLSKKTDEIIIDIVQSLVEADDGDGTYKLNFTNVESTRPDGSAFPVIEPILFNKPVYEWVNELGSTKWTNSQAEIDVGNQKTLLPMVFNIRGSDVYWYYPDGATVMTVDYTTELHEIKQITSNETSVNYLILECGEDFNGEPIFFYIYDEFSNSPIQKDAYQKQLKLAGTNATYDNSYHQLRKQAIADGDTNSQFRDRVRILAVSYARNWFRYINKGQPVLTLTLPKTDINLGDRIVMNFPRYETGTYQVKNIENSISANSWTTQLKIKKEIEETQ